MAQPTLVDSNSAYTTGGTEKTVTLGTAASAGELILLLLAIKDSGNDATVTWDVAALNTNELFDGPGSGFETRVSATYLIATGGETSFDLSLGASREAVWWALQFSGHNASVNPPEAGTIQSASGTTFDPGTVTASWGASDNLGISLTANRLNSGTVTPASGWTSFEAGAVGGTEVSGHCAYLESTSATLNPGTEEWSGSATHRGNVIVIQGSVASGHTMGALAGRGGLAGSGGLAGRGGGLAG